MRNSIFAYPKEGEWPYVKAQPQAPAVQYAHLRRKPDLELNKVRPATIQWARSIPSAIRPRALVIQFPRIANGLADAWDKPRVFAVLLEDYLIDKRGGRKGFPEDVKQDLLNLKAHFDTLQRPCKDVWGPAAN